MPPTDVRAIVVQSVDRALGMDGLLRHVYGTVVGEIADRVLADLDTAGCVVLPPGGEVDERWQTVYSADGHTSDHPADGREEAMAAVKRASPVVDAHAECREVRTWPDGSRWTGPWTAVDEGNADG